MDISIIEKSNLKRLTELQKRIYEEDPSIQERLSVLNDIAVSEKIDRGEIYLLVSHQEECDNGYAWFRKDHQEYLLVEISLLPGIRAVEGYASLLRIGLDWIHQQNGSTCLYIGPQGDTALSEALLTCGFHQEEEHIQMRANLEEMKKVSSSLKTRTFSQIGDPGWLLGFVQECLQCRETFERQDMIDVIKRADSLSFIAWNHEQPVGFLIGEIIHWQHFFDKNPVFYVLEIGVHPAFRRRGVATFLLAEGFDRARQHDLTIARLHVLGSNAAGLGLYRKLGFLEIERTGWWRWRTIY